MLGYFHDNSIGSQLVPEIVKMVAREELLSLIDIAEKDTGMRVSDEARSLIVLAVTSVSNDPNRRWRVSRDDLEEAETKIANNVPYLLVQVIEDQMTGTTGSKQVGFFEVLHFISHNLERLSADFLPFPKD